MEFESQESIFSTSWQHNYYFFLSISSGSKPTLSLGIAHNYGAIWDISWCPSGTWEPASSKINQVCTPRLIINADIKLRHNPDYQL